MNGRYFSQRDLNFIHSVNAELTGDIIQTLVIIHKIVADATKINIYGESDPSTGKIFYPGVPMTCHIKRENIDTPTENFGPDRKQNVKFAFREKMLKEINLYPEVGDVIIFNERYYEVDGVDQEQFLGGIPEKSLSIVCNTHYTRLSKLSIFERQG